MTASRMKWLLLGIPGIVFITWTTLAVQQQVKKIDDKTLKDAGKGTEWVINGMNWGEHDGLVLITDFERDKRWTRTFVLNANKPETAPKMIWSRNVQDRYNDPGTPVTRVVSGQRVILQSGDSIYLIGNGASSEGDRPFLDRFNLQTLKSERIFRSDANSYENVVALLSDDGSKFITRRESPTEAPNYYVLSAAGGAPQPVRKPPPRRPIRVSASRLMCNLPCEWRINAWPGPRASGCAWYRTWRSARGRPRF